MSKIEELYNIACSLKCENQETIIDALCFLNRPITDFVTEDYLNVKDLKKHMQFDVFSNTYRGKTFRDYEKQRLKALERVEAVDSIADGFSIAIREVAEIREGIHGINYNEMYKSCCQIEFMIDVCRNMMLQGASLTEIVKYVPGTQMGDVYHLATDHLGFHLNLSPEEKEDVERYDEMIKNGKTQSVTMRDIMRWGDWVSMPHRQSNGSGWSIDGEQIYDTYTMACVFTECKMSFPYYFEDKANPNYAETFEEVLEEIMLYPERVSVDGLEKAYSPQEWNLLNRLKMKMQSKSEEK